MNGWLRALLILIATGVVVAAGAVWHVDRWWHQPGPLTEPRVVVVEPGAPLQSVAASLAVTRVVTSERLWELNVRLRGAQRALQAGEYRIPTSASPAEVLEQLKRGDVVDYRFTIIEGWTVRDLLRALPGVPVQQTLPEGLGPDTLAEHIDLDIDNVEGWFFPDTYQVTRAHSDRDLLRRAHTRMQQELTAQWDARAPDLPLSHPAELLTLASMVEKETGHPDDRAQIAQVFARRLRTGMRLQSDPTIIYGLGDTFDGNLTRKHLITDSIYNSYTRAGLPPTPIGLPGRDSLHAAAHPATGDFLYFVSRGDGTSQFSRTLDEHQQAVRRYQLKR